MKRFYHHGFTLIEIIIAISLIGLFIALPILAYGNYLKKGRDIKRKNDINQLSTALQQYKASMGIYPASTGNFATDLAPLVARGYIPAVPADPKDGQPASCVTINKYCYTYSAPSSQQTYTLNAKLETSSAGVDNYYQATPVGTTNVTTAVGSGNPPTSTPIATHTPLPQSSTMPTLTASPTKSLTPTRTPTPSATPIPPSTWSRQFIGAKSDGINSVELATDGGYVMAGYTNTYANGGSGTDMYIVKLNFNSNTIAWTKAIGGTGNEVVNAIETTSDGGYIVVGSTTSYGSGSADFFIVKLTSAGAISWSRVIGSVNNDTAYSVKQTSDGYIVAGNTTGFGLTTTGVYLVKLDTLGNTAWTKVISNANNIGAYSIIQTSDLGYVIGGYWGPVSNTDLFIMKVDDTGTLVWQRALGSNTNLDAGTSIIQTSDTGLVVVGYASSFGAGGNDVYAAKFDINGNVLWKKTYGTARNEIAYDVIETADGGLLIAGMANQPSTVDAGYLVKTDVNGGLQWSKTYDVSTTQTLFRSVRQIGDTHYFAGGEFVSGGFSHYYAVRVDLTGAISGCADTGTSNVPTPGIGGITFIPVPSTVTGGVTAIPTPATGTGGAVTLKCN